MVIFLEAVSTLRFGLGNLEELRALNHFTSVNGVFWKTTIERIDAYALARNG